MTAAEYREACQRLGLDPAAVARLLGVNERTSRRWASGGQPIPEVYATAIAEIIESMARLQAGREREMRVKDMIADALEDENQKGGGPFSEEEWLAFFDDEPPDLVAEAWQRYLTRQSERG